MFSLLQECMEDSRKKAGAPTDIKVFQDTFCQYCRNRNCGHARWGRDKFSERVQTQTERFFNPVQADPKDPKYAILKDFQDRYREALQLQIADQRKDWEVPEIPITDGVNETALRSTTSAVDDAAIALARAKNKELTIPEPESPPPPPAAPVEEPPAETPQPAPKPSHLGNTPVSRHGIMIDGGPRPEPQKPKVDDWEAPPPPKKDVVVQPGAKIKLGGGK